MNKCQKQGCDRPGTKEITYLAMKGTIGHSFTVYACDEHEKEYQEQLNKKIRDPASDDELSRTVIITLAVVIILVALIVAVYFAFNGYSVQFSLPGE